jgi:hypothetical protein
MSETKNVPAVSDKKGIATVIAISLLVIGLNYMPYGPQILYPFSLIYTFVHEMGHGIAGMLVGARFDNFVMHLDGSGLATNMVPTDMSRFGLAFIAFGGLVAPAVMAAICFILGRSPKASRIGFYCFAGICVLALALVVRNLFGFIFVAFCGLASLAVAKLPKSGAVPRYVMLVLAITLLTFVFSRGDYLFVQEASSGLSDVGQIQKYLFLPYWFWGGLIGLISVAILIFGVVAFFRVRPTHAKQLPAEHENADRENADLYF